MVQSLRLFYLSVVAEPVLVLRLEKRRMSGV